MHLSVIGMDTVRPSELEEALRVITPNLSYFRYDTPNLVKKLLQTRPDGIVISGSDFRINHRDSPSLPSKIIDLGIPILGICYGFQWMIKKTGGQINSHTDGTLHEYGKVLDVFDSRNLYMFKHHDYVGRMSEEWVPMIYSPDGEKQIWMAKNESKKLMGIQFHPEKRKPSTLAFFKTWLSSL